MSISQLARAIPPSPTRSLNEEARILKEKGEIVYQALGWLTREDKKVFHKKEGKIFVSLSHEEREIFKKCL